MRDFDEHNITDAVIASLAQTKAHIHFMIAVDGYETLITHIFNAESPYLDSDAVFGVKNSLIATFGRNAGAGSGRILTYHFALKPLLRHAQSRAANL